MPFDPEIRRFMELVRRDHGKFRKKWLVFHGTASPALEGVVRVGAIVPLDVLRRRRIMTPTGEQYFTVREKVPAVSVIRDPVKAWWYAKTSKTLVDAQFEDILSEINLIYEELRRKRKRGVIDDLHSHIRGISNRLTSFFSKRVLRTDHNYPVIVSTVVRQSVLASRVNRFGVTTPGEEYVVQMPVHLSYFFVPKRYVDHAARVLSRRSHAYADRVFRLSVLEHLYGRKLEV